MLSACRPDANWDVQWIKQDWSKAEMINVILDATGKIREADEFTGNKKTLDFEILEL